MVCRCCEQCSDSSQCQRWCVVSSYCFDPTGTPDGDCQTDGGEWGCIKYFKVTDYNATRCDDPNDPGNVTCGGLQAVLDYVEYLKSYCNSVEMFGYSVFCVGNCCDSKCRQYPCCPNINGCDWIYTESGWQLTADGCVDRDCTCSGAEPTVENPSIDDIQTTACKPMVSAMAMSIGGAGAELKSLLSWLGLKAAKGCKCERRARYMDHMGCDWCEQNIQTIVGWLREEHDRQKMMIPFSSLAAEQLVKLAIRRARKKGIK